MNRKALAIIALQAIIIVILFWLLVFYGRDEYESYSRSDDEETIATPPRSSTENGITVVTLSAETQNESGIATSPLAAASYRSSLSALGSVVGIEGLAEMRTRYLAALADTEAVRSSLVNSQQEYRRLDQLNRDDHNVSDRAVATAQAAWKSDAAKLDAAETTVTGIRDMLRQQWGETLASWAIQQPAGNQLQSLLLHRSVLLQIALPFDAPPPLERSTVQVAPAGSRNHGIQALFVSASPQTDNAIQGNTFFYLAPAGILRTDMRVTAHLPPTGKTANGIVVPVSSVIWYAGLPWVYLKQDADHFVRRQITTEQETSEGWFNPASANLKVGDAVVTRGAQLLLSEEFKSQITNENED